MTIKDLVRDYEKATEVFHKAVEDKFKEGVKAFFVEYPECRGVQWRQYTPYFNDGDPCTFSVDEAYFRLEGMGDEEGDYEDGYDYSYDDETPLGMVRLHWYNGPGQALNIDSAMEQMFGDHVKVTATRDGFEVEDYYHD